MLYDLFLAEVEFSGQIGDCGSHARTAFQLDVFCPVPCLTLGICHGPFANRKPAGPCDSWKFKGSLAGR